MKVKYCIGSFCNEVTVGSLFLYFAQPFWLDIFIEKLELNIIVENR